MFLWKWRGVGGGDQWRRGLGFPPFVIKPLRLLADNSALATVMVAMSRALLRACARAPSIAPGRLAAIRHASTFLTDYNKHVEERSAMGIVPNPLDPARTSALVKLLEDPPAEESAELLELLSQRVPPGVDESAYVKAGFLSAIAKGTATSPVVSAKHATELLGTMQGGYNISTLVDLLDDPELAETAGIGLKKTILMFDAFHDVEEKGRAGNKVAQSVMQSWADAEWFTSRPEVAAKQTLTVFKVTGETNTDDLSPAPDAWSRPDIPLHGLAMLKIPRDGIHDAQAQMVELKEKGFQLVYVGDVVGTGSSRKSATNSVLWYMGEDIPYVPNKRGAGLCIGGKIAPIFFNTMEDSGALPLEMDVTNLNMGDVIEVYPYEGVVKAHGTEDVITTFTLKTDVLFDEARPSSPRCHTWHPHVAAPMQPPHIAGPTSPLPLHPPHCLPSLRLRRCAPAAAFPSLSAAASRRARAPRSAFRSRRPSARSAARATRPRATRWRRRWWAWRAACPPASASCLTSTASPR